MSAEPGEPGLRELGLRERKKRQTRETISGIATGLFLERGFDPVTVAEVAKAADVSEKTVFNYFPRKEDLFLDRLPQLSEMVTVAVKARDAKQSVAAAVQGLLTELVAQRHPISGYADPGYTRFWQVVIDSPALQARAREYVQELEDLLANLVAEAEGGQPGQFRARFAAAAIVTAYRTVFFDAARRILSGEDHQVVTAELPTQYARAFQAVERALDGL
ncbi:TetR family transcriptional regulator [Hamadaea sp. NPDC051192]|uniref:TetR/AcrR family transcriptional regulator n=1 Tax=Hamadaea sp. NPDC051192 TaxID=3154940 RepID=UPI0034468EE1